MWIWFIVLSASTLAFLMYYQQIIPISVMYLGIIFDGVVTGLAGSALVWCVLNLKCSKKLFSRNI